MTVNVRSPRLAGSIARSRHIVFVPILLFAVFAVRRCSIHTPIIDATDRWRRQQHAVSSQALFFISLFFRIDFPFLYNNYSEATECVRAGGCNARAADPATMAFTVSFFCSDFGVDWMTLTAAHYIYIYCARSSFRKYFICVFSLVGCVDVILIGAGQNSEIVLLKCWGKK